MDFKVGDTVVYPHHGAAVIEGIEQREFKGETVDYLVLKINQGDLSVKVPAANAEKVGVRDVVGEEGLLKVFSVLREIDVEEAGNWSRRYKANQERLTSGDVNKVAEVVRDLWRRDHIVKSQKSKVARGILTLAAAGAALTLTACSAGQITQTSNQVAAVNGVEAEVGNIALRDVSIVIDDKNALAVKFTAGNVEERGENITLNSITVDGKAVSLSGSKDVLAGGSLIGDSVDAIKNYQVESPKTAHLTYTATSLSGVSDVFIGGQKEVEFTFSTGSVTVNAPVVAYTTTQGGELHRDEKANLVDKETYKEGKEEAEH